MSLIKSVNSFKYPVLRPLGVGDDFAQGDFSITDYSVDKLDAGWQFKGVFRINHPDIAEMVNNERAICVVEFDCTALNYRRIFKFNNSNFEFILDSHYCPPEDVNYQLAFWVCVNDDEAYAPKNMHRDYQGLPVFQLKKAEIIAVDGIVNSQNRSANKRSNQNESLVDIESSDKDVLELSLNQDKIVLNLPKRLHSVIESSRGKEREGLSYLFLLPVFMEVFHKIYITDRDGGQRWAERIKEVMLDKFNVSEIDEIDADTDLYQLANKFLGAIDSKNLTKIYSAIRMASSPKSDELIE